MAFVLPFAEGHFFWGSVMYGYLIYDSLFTAAFYGAVGSPSFVAHHVLGIACCCVGLYHNKCAHPLKQVQVADLHLPTQRVEAASDATRLPFFLPAK